VSGKLNKNVHLQLRIGYSKCEWPPHSKSAATVLILLRNKFSLSALITKISQEFVTSAVSFATPFIFVRNPCECTYHWLRNFK